MINNFYCEGNLNFLGMFDFNYAPSLLFYAYLPIIIISVFFGFFVLFKDKFSYRAILLFSVSFIFTFLLFNEIMQWVTVPSNINYFSWSLVPIFRILACVFTVLFVYSFIKKERLSKIVKIFISLVVLVVIMLLPTTLNIEYFDLINCEGIPGSLWNIVHVFEILSILLILYIGIRSIIKDKKDIHEKRIAAILITGASLFLFVFFAASIWGDITTVYEVALVGPIGMLAFITFLTYLIVKFKAFDIKLLGAQALVWALIILVGSQFFYQAGMPTSSLILTAVTLLVSAIVGLIIVRSVKKEVALREQLEIANNNQEALIHFISHQIKGFFTKSKMIFSGLLEGDFGEVSPVIKDMAQVGLDSDNNAVAMVQDILGASNLKSGTTNYNFKLTDLTMVVNKVVDNFKPEMEKKGLKLETDISNVPLPAMIDETQITQVFKNLLDNSLRYTPAGEIEVSLQPNPANKRTALFTIKDSGVGLSDKDKAKLFTEGGKGDESLKVNTNSTGYGLYIVKKIVESHKGKIWAESAGRGHGSKFCVELNITA
jgi:signal transduction histidine kinase